MSVADLPVQVHRLGLGRFLAYLWLVGVALALFDVVRRGQLGAYAGWVLVVLASGLVAYSFGVRPAVVESPEAVLVRNPLRNVRVPWSGVTEVDVTDVLRLHAGAQVVRCFAVPFSRPSRGARGGQLGGLTGLNPLPAGEESPGQARGPKVGRAAALAQRMYDLSKRLGAGHPAGAPVQREWAVDGAGLVVLAAVLVVIAAGIR